MRLAALEGLLSFDRVPLAHSRGTCCPLLGRLLFHHGMTGHLRIKGTSSVKSVVLPSPTAPPTPTARRPSPTAPPTARRTSPHPQLTTSELDPTPWPRYARDVAKETETWPPKFTKIEIGFGGTKLSFADPRRLGKVRLREDATGVPPISNLATDPITEIIDPVALSVTLATVAAPIKAVLLDQQRVVCGIGNWLADDILYEAKIHPEMRPASMNRDDFVALADAITFVCAEACRVNADSSQFPPHWLFHMRWKNPRGQSTLDDGRVIQQSTVGGRATYHVIAEQQKSGRGGAGAGAEAGGAGAGARSGGARPAPKIEAPKAKRKVHKDKGKAATVKTESGAAKAVATIPSKRRKVSAVKSRALEVGANLTRRTRTARRSTEEAAGAGRTRSTSRGKK